MSIVSLRVGAALGLSLLAGALASAGASSSARASEIDSEHLFGFTEGSDIGVPGEKELESETTARIGKHGERFRAIDSGLSLKMPLTDWFRIAPGLAFAYHDIAGVSGLPDHADGRFNGAFLETRLRLLDRHANPFGLTLNLVPGVNRVETASGHPAEGYGMEFGLLADRELIPGRLVGAINFGYGLGTNCLRGAKAWQHGSGIELSGALAYQAWPDRLPGVFLGAEVRYARAYDGLGLDRLGGQAVYLGPTLYVDLPGPAWISATWSFQAAGEAVARPGPLDLTRFDRHQLRLRIGYSF